MRDQRVPAIDRAQRTQRWAREHGEALIGVPLVDAERMVEAAGLRSRVVRPGTVTTLEFGIGRITLQIDERNVVTEAHAG